MEKLAIQAVRITSGDSGIQTKILNDIITDQEIGIDQVISMLIEHGIDSERMREVADAYQLEHNKDEESQTWVVRDVTEFANEAAARHCRIELFCGIIGEPE